jgi:hypothetical protein
MDVGPLRTVGEFLEDFMSVLMLRRTVIVGGAAALAMTAWFIGRAGSLSAADSEVRPALSNVAVDCEPSQQALVRNIEVDGEPRTVVQCVTTTASAAAFTAEEAVLTSPRLVPAVYRAPVAAPARVVTAPVQPVQTVTAPAPQRTVERVAEPKRSWQTRAMVIGGSAGAGAGIGALIGGKKGALIGAAIGGGSGTVYEVVKH